MKLRIASMAKATIMIVVLAGLAFWMKDASDCLNIDAIHPTISESAKVEKISKWIPAESELFLVLDVDLALANENLKKRLQAFAANNNGAVADIVSAMLGENGLLEMVAVLGVFGEASARPEMVIIAQGDFANNDVVARLRRALGEAGSKIEEVKVAGRTILSEVGDEPFSLAELDDEHLLVGESAALKSYLARANGKPSIDDSDFPDAPLFGRLIVGDRLAKLAPEDLSGVDEVKLLSLDGKTLYAEIPSESPSAALKLKVFLMGARSVLLIRAEGNESLRSIVEDVRVGGEGSTVLLSIKISTLLDLW